MLYNQRQGAVPDQKYIAIDLGGHHVTGTAEEAIRTYQDNTGRDADNIALPNAASIDLGGIDGRVRQTVGGVTTSAQIGDIDIVSAGDVRLGYIWAYADKTAGGIASDGGDITIQGGGAVVISNKVTGVAGDILTYADTANYRGGHISISHAGRFLAGNIDTSYVTGGGGGASTGWRPGNVHLNGVNSSGGAQILGNTKFHDGVDRYRGGQAELEIKNYNNVRIEGDIIARPNDTNVEYSDFTSLEMDIKGIAGNIELLGLIDLEDTGRGSHGNVRLAADGDITLASLDLSKVGYAYLSAGGSSLIEGEIADFDTDGATGAGSQADPKVSAETRLRTPTDQKIYYAYTAGALNDALGGHVWQLKALDGTSNGGLLMVKPPAGTVIRIR